MEQRIQKAVEKFATGLAKEITSVIYDDLIDDLQKQRATNKGMPAPSNGKTPRKYYNKPATKKAGTKKAAPKKVAAKKTNGVKRTPEQVERLAARALTAVTKHPGMNVGEISKAVKASTKDLALPMRKLIEGKAIRTKGERSATTYFPKGKKAAKKKTTKKRK